MPLPVLRFCPDPDEASLPPAELFETQLPLIQEVIRFICRRHHWTGEEAADLSSHVMLKLIEDDYAVLRKFQGRSTLRTFLTTVIHRISLDYRIAQRGKWRPAAQARRMGPAAVRLDTLLSRDGYGLLEAARLLQASYPDLKDSEIYRMAAALPLHTPRRFEDEEVLKTFAAPELLPSEVFRRQERRAVRRQVEALLLQAVAGLPETERDLLRRRFEEGTPIVQIARSLGVDPKPLYRRIEAILKRLRQTLVRQGLRPEHVLESEEA